MKKFGWKVLPTGEKVIDEIQATNGRLHQDEMKALQYFATKALSLLPDLRLFEIDSFQGRSIVSI